MACESVCTSTTLEQIYIMITISVFLHLSSTVCVCVRVCERVCVHVCVRLNRMIVSVYMYIM